MNRRSYLDTAVVVLESETEDPKLIVESGVRRNHDDLINVMIRMKLEMNGVKTSMSKYLMRSQR